MVKSGEVVEQLPFDRDDLSRPHTPGPSGPSASAPMCYLSESVTLGKSIIFSLWGPAAGVGRVANGHHLEQNE